MNKEQRLEITVRYKGLKETISGSPESVTKQYLTFLSKVIPAFEVISNLKFNPGLIDMASRLKGSVHIYKGRVFILKKNLLLTDSILLVLVAKYVSFGLNLTANDSMSLQEILDSTGKTKKSIVRVLNKLLSTKAIEQLLDGRYRILDWKAYDYLLKKLPSKKSIRLTDFVSKDGSQNSSTVAAYTVGYEGKGSDQFFKMLRDENVEVLVDVRKDAYSKQDASYSEGNLSRIAAESKIKYIHLPELGIDHKLRQELRKTNDYQSYFKRYLDYLQKHSDLVEFIANLAKNNRLCLMCYEKNFKRCHRSVLAEKLEEFGITFLHK